MTNYRVLQFKTTGSVTFPDYTAVDVLVVGGGGSGTSHIGAGGGAGAVIFYKGVVLAPNTRYNITVGAGGINIPVSSGVEKPGVNGGASSIGSLFIAIGGGGAGVWTQNYVSDGGSGGGGGACTTSSTICTGKNVGFTLNSNTVNGVGMIGPTSSTFSQYVLGNSGGMGKLITGAVDGSVLSGGGGGGAGAAGGSVSELVVNKNYRCGDGGSGANSGTVNGINTSFSSFFGQAYTNVTQAVSGYIAGGGGGGGLIQSYTSITCPGGLGGGGQGGKTSNANNGCINYAATSGLANTGSGGGGAGNECDGGGGGSGLVLIRLSCNFTCGAGYYASTGTCAACPAGTYGPGTGSTNVSQCLTCPAGSYSPIGSSACPPCPTNTQSVSAGAGSCTTNPGYFLFSVTPPVIWLTMANSLTDNAGSAGAAVTVVGTVTYQTGVCRGGICKNSAIFSSDPNEYLMITTNQYAPLTMALWISPASNGTYYGVGGIGAAFYAMKIILSPDSINGQISVVCALPGPVVVTSSTRGYSSTSWTHIAVTVGGTSAGSEVRLYVNGVFVGSAVPPNPVNFASVAVMRVGMSSDITGAASTYDYIGYASDARLYPLQFSDGQVSALYAQSFMPSQTYFTCAPSCTGSTVSRCLANGTSVCCSAGQYFIEGVSSACTACRNGTFAPAGNGTACQTCPAGLVSSDGASVCYQLTSVGFYFDTASSSQLPCPTGTYGTGQGYTSATQCSNCTPGTFSSSTGRSVCSNCPAGGYGLMAARVCLTCPMGTFSLSAASSCIPCAPESYSLAAASSCFTCPTNAWALPGSSVCVSKPGYFQFTMPQPAVWQSMAISAEANTGTLGGAVYPQSGTVTYQQNVCRDGICKNAAVFSGSAFSAIVDSWTDTITVSMWVYPGLSSQRMSVCSLTVSGGLVAMTVYLSPDGITGQISATAILAPSRQTFTAITSTRAYTNTGWVHIAITVGGVYGDVKVRLFVNGILQSSSIASNTGLDPATGYLMVGGPGGAIDRYVGYLSDFRRYSQFFTEAQVSALYQQGLAPGLTYFTCVNQCTGSTVARCLTDGTSVCCSAGQYFVEGVSSQCANCLTGTFSLFGNATSCQICEAGTVWINGALPCVPVAPAGFYFDVVSFSQIPCPAGTYGLNQGYSSVTQCTVCSLGKFSGATGQSLGSACQNCSAGTIAGISGATVCSNCTAGTFVGDIGRSVCTQCTTGTYSSGRAAAAMCSNCTAGTFASDVGRSVCSNCTAGTYSPGTGVSTCQSCVAGAYNTGIASLSISSCSGCKSGTFSGTVGASTSDTCSNCPAGTYSTGQGIVNSSACLACGAGTFSPTQGAINSSTCLLGPAGMYGTGIGQPSDISFKPCRYGQYSTTLGSSSYYQCINCPIGTYSPILGSASNSSCLLCIAGTYTTQVGLFMVEHCLFCDAGTYSTGSGMTSSAICSLCMQGMYSPSIGALSSGACVTCQTGEYSTGSGMDSGDTCLKCVTGSYGPAVAATACSNCSAGKYSNISGATNSSACLPCRAGTFSPTPGLPASSQCTGCGAGSFSTASGAVTSSTCSACPIGSYSTIPGSSVCSLCPSLSNTSSGGSFKLSDCACYTGYFGNPGLGQACTTCPANYYCNSTAQIACPTGTFSSTGATALSQCGCQINASVVQSLGCTCDPGFKQTTNALSLGGWDCRACGTGSYCRLGIQLPCPDNSLSTSSYGQYITDCQCNPGYYWNATLLVCVACPLDRYCNYGLLNACPASTNSPMRSAFQADCRCSAGNKCLRTRQTRLTITFRLDETQFASQQALVRTKLALLAGVPESSVVLSSSNGVSMRRLLAMDPVPEFDQYIEISAHVPVLDLPGDVMIMH